jgi:hypothetical protein
LEQAEQENLIEELETRVDRLRGLYDQYFMGIEKMIPSVPQKEVERRFYVLRREQIRNTALRFRFQNVLLKYNTYQTYWMRICRQIEEGTYKRDVRRANARFANPPAKSKKEREAELEELDDLDVEVDLDEAAAMPSFEDEELARAREEVAKMREALRASKAPKEPPPRQALPRQAAPPNAPPPPPSEAPPTEPTTERKIPVVRPAGGAGYAQRGAGGRKRTSDLPPALPIVGVDTDRDPSVRLKRATSRPPAAAPAAGTKRKSTRPPAAAPPPGAPPRARLQAPPAAAHPGPARPGNLSDERVRQIYTQYVETKRKTGESTAALTYDSLARSLRDSSEKLREKHRGRNVDFEVAVKDGKAVLRPVVK